MADQFSDFITVLDAFDKHGVDYILIGGVAMVLHGLERLTRDIDVFVNITPENIDNLRQALQSVFVDPSIDEITLGELNQYPVIRYGAPSGLVIDIISRLGEMATFDDLAYDIVNVQGIKIRLATPETLYRLKKNTIRDKDRMDAMFLKELINARGSD